MLAGCFCQPTEGITDPIRFAHRYSLNARLIWSDSGFIT